MTYSQEWERKKAEENEPKHLWIWVILAMIGFALLLKWYPSLEYLLFG